jgi:2-polyprenyl-3-methyl-5-hydroxy-6-metoxy-1,4-benzoquinol methylase
MKCRHCAAPLDLPLIDLGSAPPSNAYLRPDDLHGPETWYPLRVLVCEHCWLVQTEDFARAESLFSADYAYFSSVSSSWLEHAQRYVAGSVERFGLGPHSHVVEIAANDGYLLQYVQARGIPCTGIEPTASTAAAARVKGLNIVEAFFGREQGRTLAQQGQAADLMVANNVLAHVPDINDFVAGFAALMKPQGVASFEFPHLLRLIAEAQFDTIYHEHFSYLSLTAVVRIFAAQGLQVFDVETLPTHGGSLRVWAQHTSSGGQPIHPSVAQVLADEQAAGLCERRGYEGSQGLQARAEAIKHGLLRFLLDAKQSGQRVAAYGAAAKGNTLLNFAGVRPDLIDYVVDRNPAKQGQYLPGSRIPIVPEGRLAETRPDFILVLPWNLHDELAAQLAYTRDWGARLFTAVPTMAFVGEGEA